MADEEETQPYDETPPEAYGEPVDASRYLSEIRKEALSVLFPSPTEMAERIDLITVLKGKPPDLYQLYRGAVIWEVFQSIIEDRDVNWALLEPITFLKAHSPSIQGQRAKQAVEIGRAVVPPERRRSMFDALRNR